VTYLADLTLRLTMGAAQLPGDLRQRHTAYLLSQQRPDGGFSGREGPSDPYYTGFALRALAVLGELTPEVAERSRSFLEQRMQGRESVIDLISLVFSAAILELHAGLEVLAEAPSDWPQRLAALLESYRREDGGYAKSNEGRAGSTYQTFLTTLCYELLEVPQPDAPAVVDFLRQREHEEGGFLEIRVAKRAGVNPTAAAIGALKTLGQLDDALAQRTIDFLVDQQSDDGGFTANTRIPLSDLLSTCTGLITLADLGAVDQIAGPPALQFVHSMQRETGGFAGFAFDPAEDVEYTFYGLAALSLLQ
jgi:geranylgeranyl transferase type-2 subunit beta